MILSFESNFWIMGPMKNLRLGNEFFIVRNLRKLKGFERLVVFIHWIWKSPYLTQNFATDKLFAILLFFQFSWFRIRTRVLLPINPFLLFNFLFSWFSARTRVWLPINPFLFFDFRNTSFATGKFFAVFQFFRILWESEFCYR